MEEKKLLVKIHLRLALVMERHIWSGLYTDTHTHTYLCGPQVVKSEFEVLLPAVEYHCTREEEHRQNRIIPMCVKEPSSTYTQSTNTQTHLTQCLYFIKTIELTIIILNRLWYGIM